MLPQAALHWALGLWTCLAPALPAAAALPQVQEPAGASVPAETETLVSSSSAELNTEVPIPEQTLPADDAGQGTGSPEAPPVPEPTVLALVGGGLLMVSMVRRRREEDQDETGEGGAV